MKNRAQRGLQHSRHPNDDADIVSGANAVVAVVRHIE